jgi:hypothetical protein
MSGNNLIYNRVKIANDAVSQFLENHPAKDDKEFCMCVAMGSFGWQFSIADNEIDAKTTFPDYWATNAGKYYRG